jgi:hypothetical protein
MRAQDRFEHGMQHEKPLAEFRVLACRNELESALQLLPLHYLESELATLLFLVRSMPARVFAKFHNVHTTFYVSLNELIIEIADLQHIYALKSQIAQGSHVAQLARTVHLQTSGIKRELDLKFSEDRLSRLQFKQQGGKTYDHLSPLMAAKHRASDDLKQRYSVVKALVSAVDKSPLQWTITGLATSSDALIARMGVLRDVLYNVTKFHPMTLDEDIRNVRQKWFISFRRLLDGWQYDVPGPARDSGPLSLVVREWASIQAYKIRTRPDMITKQEVKLGRGFYAKTVMGIPGEGRSSLLKLDTDKDKKPTKKDHMRKNAKRKASKNWYNQRKSANKI